MTCWRTIPILPVLDWFFHRLSLRIDEHRRHWPHRQDAHRWTTTWTTDLPFPRDKTPWWSPFPRYPRLRCFKSFCLFVHFFTLSLSLSSGKHHSQRQSKDFPWRIVLSPVKTSRLISDLLFYSTLVTEGLEKRKKKNWQAMSIRSSSIIWNDISCAFQTMV